MSRETTDELRVQARVFLGIGAIVTVMAGIYVATAYEDAGSVMLVLAAGLSFVCAAYLWIQLRATARDTPAGTEAPGEPDQYLPHASIWPFVVGVAGFLLANGLILGTWFVVPGGLLLVIGVVGFVRQSRRRS